MKKNIIMVLLLTTLCSAQERTPRQRVYIRQRSLDPAKITINDLLIDLENTLHTAAEKAGVLRRKINHLGSGRSIRAFRAELQNICTQVKDLINMTEPRIAGELEAVQ
jgi:hypothetical protein